MNRLCNMKWYHWTSKWWCPWFWSIFTGIFWNNLEIIPIFAHNLPDFEWKNADFADFSDISRDLIRYFEIISRFNVSDTNFQSNPQLIKQPVDVVIFVFKLSILTLWLVTTIAKIAIVFVTGGVLNWLRRRPRVPGTIAQQFSTLNIVLRLDVSDSRLT